METADNSAAVRGRPFSKGSSGNPGGRPKGFAEFQEKCRKLAPKALAVLQEALTAADDRLRVQAAQTVLDRAYGKPAQAITGAGGEAVTLNFVIDLGGK